MSINTTIRAHLSRQERLDHNISKYASYTHPEERAVQTIHCIKEVTDKLRGTDRKRLLSLANMEMTDASFRRYLILALNS